MSEIYLDNAATTRVIDDAVAVAAAVMRESYGNPSSAHTMGREAKRILDKARLQIATVIGADPSEIVFTSGGTESNNWALLCGADSNRRNGRHIISSAAEHDAVLKALERLEEIGFSVTRLRPNRAGGVNIEDVEEVLRPDTAVISLMLVNNETGAITDIAAISRMLRERGSGALLHTDAVQALLKIPVNTAELGVDLMSLSAHKIHGIKGIGALYIRRGVHIPPLLLGGGQESGLRSGTESLPLIAAFGEAAHLGFAEMPETLERMRSIRLHAIERLCEENPELVINGVPECSAPHVLSISMPGHRSEVLMNFLESHEIYVSKSSACKRGARSHVLTAMGISPRIIDGALRVSLSRYTTVEDIDAFCDAIREARERLLRA